MKLSQHLEKVLQQAVVGGAVQATDGSDTIECALSAIDSIGVGVDRLTLSTSRLANADAASMRALAERLASRLTYLLEPVAPVEIDADSCSLQLRSRPPRKSESVTSYYELLASRGGTVTLVRYEKARQQGRTTVPFFVTREVLLRLVDDFVDATQ